MICPDRKRGTLSLTFSFRKPSRPKKKPSKKLWESSRPFQQNSVCRPKFWPLSCSDIQLAAQEAKLVTAHNALSGIRGRLREIMEQQEAVALERGQIALDYAVRLLNDLFQDFSNKTDRTLSMRLG